MKLRPLQNALDRAPVWLLTIFAMATAFSTYFCMYAFRKPFSAGKFEGLSFLGSGVELKTALVIGQLLGYTLSKYLGIKLVSEMTRAKRAVALVVLISVAEGSLLLFAVVPDNLKVAAIFVNGLPLGMVWGLVVWYLEGRRTSELLLAGLSCSFILASGVVKGVGKALMGGQASLPVFAIDYGRTGPGGESVPFQVRVPNMFHGFGEISEAWMPFATGAVFLVPFLVSVWLINHMPEPNTADIAARAEREPMDGKHRMGFVRAFLPGLVMLFVVYFFLTAYRDFRDNYAVEILEGLGYADDDTIFARMEVWVAFGVMAVQGGLNLIKNNRWGLLGAFGVMGAGCLLMLGSTLAHDAGMISGLAWMVCNGFGAYLAYVPFGSVLFDRMIASTRVVGTAVFAIYVADALGYTGAIGVQLYRDFFASGETRLAFFHGLTYAMAGLGAILFAASAVYFARRTSGAALGRSLPTGEESNS
ncbi:MAG: hypothetical protein IT431_16300 [Phycisphaerales bacterium]|nr:hypothetical protein [Phycisphaerales bacterium]